MGRVRLDFRGQVQDLPDLCRAVVEKGDQITSSKTFRAHTYSFRAGTLQPVH